LWNVHCWNRGTVTILTTVTTPYVNLAHIDVLSSKATWPLFSRNILSATAAALSLKKNPIFQSDYMYFRTIEKTKNTKSTHLAPPPVLHRLPDRPVEPEVNHQTLNKRVSIDRIGHGRSTSQKHIQKECSYKYNFQRYTSLYLYNVSDTPTVPTCASCIFLYNPV
jgi:hypothetical protein